MKNLIKGLISVIIFYLACSFIKWDFEWYLTFGNYDSMQRVVMGFILLLSIALIYCIISLVELNIEW